MSNWTNLLWDFFTKPSSRQDSYEALPFNGVLWPVIVINIMYVSFVYKIGPWLMRNRQPCQLKGLIRYYNIGQIIYNTMMAYMGIYLFIYIHPVPLGCITTLPMDHSSKQREMIISYLFVLNKFIDYIDTIFFVLRKSYKQVTFLHIYHHLMMTMMTFFSLKYGGSGGHLSSIGILNSITHVFMYTYYLISATNPGVKNSIWWKKYITRLQILQFVLILIHQLWPLIIEPDCKASKILCSLSTFQVLLMIYMFTNFYINAYIRKPKKGTAQKAK